MSEARPGPHGGAPEPDELRSPPGAKTPPGSPRPMKDVDGGEIDLPPVPLLAPGSNDDSFLASPSAGRMASAEPDPILGAFVTPSSSESLSTGLEKPRRSAPSGHFPTINLGAPAGSSKRLDRASSVDQDRSDDGEYEPEGRRTPWATVLLASYASAVTLALGWTLWKSRGREKVEDAPRSPVVAIPESARQSGLSRKVEPPEPLAGEHVAKIGQTIKVGSLEITPIDVKRQDVWLQRMNTYASPGRKEGGKRALVLRLKLRNTSTDAVFSPLDQAYLRERGKQVLDTFIQTANDERVYPFPLALDSEWSIVGQDLSELRPGESRVAAIVSAPEAPPDGAGPFTWRVRLRTDINRTDAVGVRWPDKPAVNPNTKK